MAADLPLIVLREKCAAAVAYSARRLWRRRDLTDQDQVVMELLAEALARLGHLLRPQRARSAAEVLAKGPPRVSEMVAALLPLAVPSSSSNGCDKLVAPSDDAVHDSGFTDTAAADLFVPVEASRAEAPDEHEVVLPFAQEDDESGSEEAGPWALPANRTRRLRKSDIEGDVFEVSSRSDQSSIDDDPPLQYRPDSSAWIRGAWRSSLTSRRARLRSTREKKKKKEAPLLNWRIWAAKRESCCGEVAPAEWSIWARHLVYPAGHPLREEP